MSKNLVIVESPAWGKTIKKYLCNDYRMLASSGQIVDLSARSTILDGEKVRQFTLTDDTMTIPRLIDSLRQSVS